MTDYVHIGAFNRNILLAGKANCSKSTLAQKRGINNFFGKLLKVEWISFIQLSKNREAKIQTCFSCLVQFHYPRSLEDLDDLNNILASQDEQNYEKFREEDKFDTSPPNFFREETERDKLIFMDDVSDLADLSHGFTSFPIVRRKFQYSCICNFHITYPEKDIWKLILSQT